MLDLHQVHRQEDLIAEEMKLWRDSRYEAKSKKNFNISNGLSKVSQMPRRKETRMVEEGGVKYLSPKTNEEP